jgi:hypothetical protein
MMTTCLAFDYLSPLAWASIRAIAAILDKVWRDLNSHKARLNLYKAEVSMLVENQVKLRQEDFYLLLEEFKIEFILASRGLGGRLDNDELKLI